MSKPQTGLCFVCKQPLDTEAVCTAVESSTMDVSCSSCGRFKITAIAATQANEKNESLALEVNKYSALGLIPVISFGISNQLRIIRLEGKDQPEFHLVSELSERLRVSEMTIYRYIKAGRLDAYKLGKEFRVTKEAFEKFLREHEL